MRRRLNYANVTATLALFFAMTGGALAAKHYLINSTKQINPKVLKALKGNVGHTGAQGIQGIAGKEGAPGKEGKEGKAGPVVLGAIKEVRGTEVFVKKNLTGTSTAKCPAGYRAISGGDVYEIEQGQAAPNFVRSEASAERKGWFVEAGNPTGNTEELFIEAVAYCAPEGTAVSG